MTARIIRDWVTRGGLNKMADILQTNTVCKISAILFRPHFRARKHLIILHCGSFSTKNVECNPRTHSVWEQPWLSWLQRFQLGFTVSETLRINKPCMLCVIVILYIMNILHGNNILNNNCSCYIFFDVIIDNDICGDVTLYIVITPLNDIFNAGLVFMSANHNIWKLEIRTAY